MSFEDHKSKFKVGDKVDILGRVSGEGYKGVSYNPEYMDEFIGSTQTVVSLNTYGFPMTEGSEGYRWTWHDDWLELAEEEFNPMPEIKAGDDVYHDHGGCGEYSKVILQTNGSLVIVCWSTYEAVSLESLNIAKVFKESAGVVWEYKEPPKSTPEFTMEELQDKLGYEFKLVKGDK